MGRIRILGKKIKKMGRDFVNFSAESRRDQLRAQSDMLEKGESKWNKAARGIVAAKDAVVLGGTAAILGSMAYRKIKERKEKNKK